MILALTVQEVDSPFLDGQTHTSQFCFLGFGVFFFHTDQGAGGKAPRKEMKRQKVKTYLQSLTHVRIQPSEVSPSP